MLYIGYLIILDGQNIKKNQFRKSIAFGMSTLQRIYPKQHTPKIGYKLDKYGLKHALHSLDGHIVWSQ